MSRIRILPEAVANSSGADIQGLGGRSFSSDIKLKASWGFSP
jgi:hypothetical protein